MQNHQRRGLLGLVATLPLAGMVGPAVVRPLRPLTPGQIAEFRTQFHGAALSAPPPVLMPGEPFHPGPEPVLSALAPAGWDTLENVR